MQRIHHYTQMKQQNTTKQNKFNTINNKSNTHSSIPSQPQNISITNSNQTLITKQTNNLNPPKHKTTPTNNNSNQQT